ncbi:MAG: hypothetical protein L0Z53_08315 [Acidobacteriales bacterium]|nr:hypothetical protein [Terriglobales bacterium]
MKRAVAMVTLACFMSLSAFAYAAQKGSWKGWVSDEKCGAAGASADKAECTKKCIESGQKLVFVNDKDKSVLSVTNPEALKGHEGHHIKVKGRVENGALTVESASMLK